MVGRTASETNAVVNRIEKSITQIRCATCRARLFDARVAWREVTIRDALIAIRCWRCKRIIGLTNKD